MHGEIHDFLNRFIAESGIASMDGRHVVEVGAYEINGSAREVLEPGTARYVGVDWRPGPGVDVVGLAHDTLWRLDGHFDVAVSCQMLEHDPHWAQTLAVMVEAVCGRIDRVRAAEPGDTLGWLVVTCAGPGYVEHEHDTAPAHHHGAAGTYYENRSADDVEREVRSAADVISHMYEVEVRVDFHGVMVPNFTQQLDVLCWARLTRG